MAYALALDLVFGSENAQVEVIVKRSPVGGSDACHLALSKCDQATLWHGFPIWVVIEWSRGYAVSVGSVGKLELDSIARRTGDSGACATGGLAKRSPQFVINIDVVSVLSYHVLVEIMTQCQLQPRARKA